MARLSELVATHGQPPWPCTRQAFARSALQVPTSDRTHTQQLFLFVVVMCESVHQSSLAQTSSNETRVSKPPPRRGMLCVCHRTIDQLLCSRQGSRTSHGLWMFSCAHVCVACRRSNVFVVRDIFFSGKGAHAEPSGRAERPKPRTEEIDLNMNIKATRAVTTAAAKAVQAATAKQSNEVRINTPS